jgi:hypothetical protein
MKRIKAILTLATLTLLSMVFCKTVLAQQPPDNVGGDWTIYSTDIQNNEIVVKHVQIAQYGNRITGYFEGPYQSGPIQGRVDVHHIMFSTVTRNVLTFRGQIYGDNMSGLYGLHGKHAPWQAVRPATAVAPAPPNTGAVYQSQPVLAPAVTQAVYQTQAQAPAAAPVAQPAAQPATDSNSDSNSSSNSNSGSSPDSNSTAQGSSAPAPAPLSSDQLDSLVAPIALYPDALVAQVLAAASNPDQVAYAEDWLSQNQNLTGTALAQAVDQQSWDPSVKALTQFPSVLANLAHNLSWTSSLGQAFANQQSDVMAAVQAMRAKAQTAGTLQSTTQITVTQPTPTTIVIQPANPQVVYVPQYNPTVVYGAPLVVPMYVPPPVPVAAVGLYFGSGISIGASFGGGGGWGGGFGWGWHAWNVNWGCCGGGGSTTIIYNHNTYINNRTWNNTNYNGYHPWGPGNAGYHPGTDTHYGPNGAYHPNGYYGPNGGFHHDVPGTNPKDQPNGGNNGNHGLIGGNGGTQQPAHADGTAWGDRGPNGGHNGDNGMIGGNGGTEHAAGYVPTHDQPNGGQNGDHGLIGGNGGVQRPATDPGRTSTGGNQLSGRSANEDDHNHSSGDQNRSRMSGDGAANRAESNRGRSSMARRPQMHQVQHRAPVQHSSGGGRRR